MLRGCWVPQAREEQASWSLLATTDLQTALQVTRTGIWLLSLIFRTSSVCSSVVLCCNYGGFFSTIIYSCKMYLEQFPQSHKIHLCSVSFLKCSVQQDQRLMERGKFNQISATLFLQSWCFFFSIQITLISETFLPMIFMTIHKSHLLVEQTEGNFWVSLLCSLCPLLHETQLSLK